MALIDSMKIRPSETNYEIDPDAVAEALISRVNQLADERAQYRRALIRSVEMLVTGDVDGPAVAV